MAHGTQAASESGPVRVLGVMLPRWLWLLVCVAGIYVCFLTWGFLQERVATKAYTTGGHKEVFSSFIFLQAVQALVAAAWTLVYRLLRGLPPRLPAAHVAAGYAQIAAAASIGAYSGYRSLGFVPFPLVVLSKSGKLVPVMLVQSVFFRKRYPWYKVLSVALVTLGVAAFFALQPSKGDRTAEAAAAAVGAASSYAWVGLVLVAFNLLLDGFVNAKEDDMFRKDHITSADLMLFMNLAQAALMAVYLAVNPFGDNQLVNATGFLVRHPAAVQDILAFAVVGALGQTFVFLTLESFGSIVLVTITVTRKIFTVVLSVLWFGHNLSLPQWGAVALVFGGIFVESFADHLLPHAKPAPSSASTASAATTATTTAVASSTTTRPRPRRAPAASS